MQIAEVVTFRITNKMQRKIKTYLEVKTTLTKNALFRVCLSISLNHAI